MSTSGCSISPSKLAGKERDKEIGDAYQAIAEQQELLTDLFLAVTALNQKIEKGE